VLDGILKLLHPLMPHITEEIWHTLNQISDDRVLALQSYPEPNPAWVDQPLEQKFDLIIGAIRTIRNLRAEADIKPSMKISAVLQSESDRERQILTAAQSYIQDIARVDDLTIATTAPQQKMFAGVVGTVQILIPLEGVVDVEALRAKLEKDLGKVELEIKSLGGRLGNVNFVNKAPEEVVQGAREALAEAQKQAEILQNRLEQL
jgi:valyl-tRNA synthetase